MDLQDNEALTDKTSKQFQQNASTSYHLFHTFIIYTNIGVCIFIVLRFETFSLK
jgi:hypothetical protein